MKAPVLSVENLTKNYRLSDWRTPNKVLRAIDNITFQLYQGQTLAIVGESGSGKSSLARQLVGIEAPSEGRILINNQDISTLHSQERKRTLQKVRMVFQNPQSSLNPHSRVGSTLEEPLKINTNLESKQRKDLVIEVLKKVGLRPEHTSRFPHMFSGGQQQRIAIARALILDPEVIVADEPLSALDVSVQAQILNLLMKLQEELELSYVFISHDLGVVEHISDQVMVMYRGQMMEYGEVDQIFDSPMHPYTRKLLSSTPTYRHTVSFLKKTHSRDFKLKANSADGCSFAARCPYAKEECIESKPKTRNIAGQLVTCHWPLS
ncbi:ABC transporter ATP-binding protein [Pleionea litopenaei]|uniref:Dipeptide ABC transporter ATP-binding protein n=1 Tax=Pleionea litopenaei TaxID=3070815 RepID=A0AA51RVX8_9GAMM|nr:dipeptide ABC transporter ATP-binding protein [Pleionea sp. HL-JVS1]WMS88572.1 dipeptide ABC transporter ATP-binding protein [Pleionea sp. HL-JVS1]